MARPRSNKSSRNETSFGKRSAAEKSFRKRPRSKNPDRSETPPRPYGNAAKDEKPKTFRSRPYGGAGKDEKPKSFRPRPYGGAHKDEKPKSFRSRPYGSAGKDEKPKSFRSRPFDSKSNSGDDRRSFPDNKRPFKKPYGDRDGAKDKPSKKPFQGTRQSDSVEKNDERGPAKPERKSFIQSRVISVGDFTKRVQPGKEVQREEPKEGLIRLNKFIANSGVGSRREADKLIEMGLISVNGTTVTELGSKVKYSDVVRYEDRVLRAEKLVYILLNKPKGFITTTEDPQERNTVMGLVAGACKERIYPVGRLDRNTTGILLLTNDGDLADKLTHPSYKARKVYKAELDKPLTKADFQKIKDGVHLEEGRAQVDDLAIISDDGKTIGLEIHIGWNRIVRRIFEAVGYTVVRLDRSVYAGLDKKDVSRGQWRFLKPEEVVRLKHFK